MMPWLIEVAYIKTELLKQNILRKVHIEHLILNLSEEARLKNLDLQVNQGKPHFTNLLIQLNTIFQCKKQHIYNHLQNMKQKKSESYHFVNLLIYILIKFVMLKEISIYLNLTKLNKINLSLFLHIKNANLIQ